MFELKLRRVLAKCGVEEVLVSYEQPINTFLVKHPSGLHISLTIRPSLFDSASEDELFKMLMRNICNTMLNMLESYPDER